MTSGGCKVDVRWTWGVGGGGEALPDYKYKKPESDFLMVKWSTRNLVNIWGLS